MKIKKLHRWPETAKAAVVLQRHLADQLRFEPFDKYPKYIAGADIAYDNSKGKCYAGVFIFDYCYGDLVESRYIVDNIVFPYIPGCLSFREIPPLLKVFNKLVQTPEVVFVDGHGIAHPRGIGIASHLGLWLNIPTIGIAKKKLVGNYQEPLAEYGKFSYLYINNEIFGAVLRTRKNTKPVFISAGHLMDLDSALSITLSVCDGYRIPYPTRISDRKVGEFKRGLIC